mgnify:CR=1 FL=1
MNNPAVIDGARLLSWARRAAQDLEAHREEINSLNVFPVPDSDTGSNMAHTMTAAVEHAEMLEDGAGVAEIASALAVGSVRGARGNSGVVLSQVLRGVAQAAAEGDLDGSSVADALTNAVGYVERAITEPVEGTIVTVLREAAEAACNALSGTDGAGLSDVTSAAVSAAEDALAKTPSQLAELRAAGVVDAGGRGLVLLLTALRDEVVGTDRGNAGRVELASGTRVKDAAAYSPGQAHVHGRTGWLEIMFMFVGRVDELESALKSKGMSLVIARVDDAQAMIHIHSLDAGAVIEQAYSMGAVSDLRLEILPDPDEGHGAATADRLIVAVTPTGSVAELFRQAGAVPVRSDEDLAARIQAEMTEAGARELVILPNGQAGPPELEQMADAVQGSGTAVAVLSTQRLVGGIAALAVYDPRLSLDAAAGQMDEAAADMRAADIVAGEGTQIAVLASDGAVLAEEESVQLAVDKACRAMLAEGGELITLLLDADAAAGVDATELESALGAEVSVYPVDGLGAVGQIGVE